MFKRCKSVYSKLASHTWSSSQLAEIRSNAVVLHNLSLGQRPLKASSCLQLKRLFSSAHHFRFDLTKTKLSRLSNQKSAHSGRCDFHSGGWRGKTRLFAEPSEQIALYGLIAANVAAFFAWRIDQRFMLLNSTTSWEAVKNGRIHTLITCAFSQRDTWHLLGNMIGLFFFGRSAAWMLGGSGLIKLYLAGGLVGSLVYVASQAYDDYRSRNWRSQHWFSDSRYSWATPALGASGAVNAIVIFDVLLVPSAKVLIYGILPMPAWALGGLWLFTDISGALGHGKSDVGYFSHLGGAAVGALAYFGVRRGRLPSRWRR